MSHDEKKLLWEVETCIEQKRFREAKELLSDMEPADIAEGLEDLPSAQLVLYFRLLLKDLALSEERLSKIQEVQLRFMAPRELDEIPAEIIVAIRKDLEAITGVEYGSKEQ